MAAENVVISTVTGAAVSVAFINWLKASPYFPWISQERVNLLRFLAVITSGIGALGIHYTWDPTAHALTFTGLSLAAIFAGAVAWVKSFAVQELAYQATRKNNGTPPAVAEKPDDQQKQRSLSPTLPTVALLLAGLTLFLFGGCAVRHLPGGATQKATNFEQILAWNAAAAQANDGFADNVIGLQQAGFLGIPEAKNILLKQGAIAQADQRITDRISAAAKCAGEQAGPSATAAQLDAAAAACAQISGPGLASDINLILGSLTDLNSGMLLGVKNDAKRQALSELLATIQTLVGKIYSSLETQGVIK